MAAFAAGRDRDLTCVNAGQPSHCHVMIHVNLVLDPLGYCLRMPISGLDIEFR
jgi:hypothetical protein